MERSLSAPVVQERDKVPAVLFCDIAEELPGESLTGKGREIVVFQGNGVRAADIRKQMPVEVKILFKAVQFAQS